MSWRATDRLVCSLGCMMVALQASCGARQGTIGAVLSQSPDGELTIREAPEGLAAEEAGLQPGDKVLLIDGIDVRGLDADRVHGLLSGEVGAPVKLTVVRGEKVVRVTLKRTPARKWSSRHAGAE